MNISKIALRLTDKMQKRELANRRGGSNGGKDRSMRRRATCWKKRYELRGINSKMVTSGMHPQRYGWTPEIPRETCIRVESEKNTPDA